MKKQKLFFQASILLVIFMPLLAFAQAQSAPQVRVFDRNLYFGLKNNTDVRNLQEFLSKHGYYKGPITGNLFLLTMEAVRKFQQANNISPTGYFGIKSREAANKTIKNSTVSETINLSASSTPIISNMTDVSNTASVSASNVVQPSPAVSSVRAPGESVVITQASSSSPYVNLISSGTIVDDGTPVTLSWTSNGVTSCQAGGNWTGSQPTYGIYQTGSLFASIGSYTFSLSCNGPFSGTVNSIATITVKPAAPTITISAPVDQETLTMGRSYIIKWVSSDNAGILSTARIDLYKNGSYQRSVVENTPNNGSYVWNIPAALATGNDYQIRIWNINYPNNYKDSPKFGLNASPTSSGDRASIIASIIQSLANLSRQAEQLMKK